MQVAQDRGVAPSAPRGRLKLGIHVAGPNNGRGAARSTICLASVIVCSVWWVDYRAVCTRNCEFLSAISPTSPSVRDNPRRIASAAVFWERAHRIPTPFFHRLSVRINLSAPPSRLPQTSCDQHHVLQPTSTEKTLGRFLQRPQAPAALPPGQQRPLRQRLLSHRLQPAVSEGARRAGAVGEWLFSRGNGPGGCAGPVFSARTGHCHDHAAPFARVSGSRWP